MDIGEPGESSISRETLTKSPKNDKVSAFVERFYGNQSNERSEP